MIKRLTVILAAVLLGACAYHPAMKGDKYDIDLEFYSEAEAARICIEKYNRPVGTGGCTICKGRVCTVIVNRHRGCMDHEMDHVVYGNWHGERPAGCDERANWRQ